MTARRFTPNNTMVKGYSVTVDTNVFLRSADVSSADYGAAKDVLLSLIQSKVHVLLSPQIIHECWVVLTRSLDKNGFGLSVEQAYEFTRELSRFYRIRQETKRCFMTWLGLVKEHDIKGVKAHDARLVAWMITNGIEKMITFNVSDFDGLPIKVIHPARAQF